MITKQARRINVKGVVQGVGFRPFIYKLARAHSLTGWVCNTSGDVTIVIEGDTGDIDKFADELEAASPSNSHIESIVSSIESPTGYTQFEIRESLIGGDEYQIISPDLGTCPDCKTEIFDPTNRRYRYPFTNCTHCGPRFTIIKEIPYDRSRTTMEKFRMCPDCQREYDDPGDRRFHAQPNACPVCGPVLELTDSRGRRLDVPDVIAHSAQLLKEGSTLAIKGLGGFLLTCDAVSNAAIEKLRDRKQRPAKPLAVMFKDIDDICLHCQVNEKEYDALRSTASPIVLLRKKERRGISPLTAPALKYLGVMLPYTPLHHLLISEFGGPLVMTSGNMSEEPIAKDNAEAVHRLQGIADYFILHNRDIYSRYDDSVVTVEQDRVKMIRRARGYAPYPIHLPFYSKPILACGAEMKNTFCLAREKYAFVSQYIGDMDNALTLEHFEETLRTYKRLFRIQPEAIACDMHPDYLPAIWAKDQAAKDNLPLITIQHHHAHIASCMADNGIYEPVIGVAFDGTGYGTDGKIWGGEFMVADYQSFKRAAHLEYLPLPGGDSAVKKPYRTAAGYICSLFGPEALGQDLPGLRELDEYENELIQKQVYQGLNTPWTSSCGRLFDVISSLLGIRQVIDYEGQAAIELEATSDENLTEGAYPFHIEVVNGIKVIRIREILSAVITDIKSGKQARAIAALFHNTMANIVMRVCLQLHEETGIKLVALSGGVFQNRRLLSQVFGLIKKNGLTPLIHTHSPCHDGGISLGQAAIANFIKVEN